MKRFIASSGVLALLILFVACTSVGDSKPGVGSADQLGKMAEIEFTEPTPVRQIFEEIARVYFSGRFESVGETDATFKGKITQRPLRELLDSLCADVSCSWRTEGSPATLIFLSKGGR